MRVETTDAYASELLHSSRYTTLSAADHALLTELVMGVLRWRGVLDDKVAAFSTQPLVRLDREVLTSLRLGAYQLLFLDRIPAHAAIHESVELVKRARKKSAAGMVNAVLRKVSGHPTFAYGSTHPKWLVERWDATYGGEIASKICQYDQVNPHVAVRLTPVPPSATGEHGSPSRTRASGTTQALPHEQSDLENIRLEPGKLLSHAAHAAPGDVTRSKAFREHRLIIQDEASQLVALLVGTGASILDCCAAPGGKTRILARQNPDATVVALDLHPHRARLMRKLVTEANVRIMAGDVRHLPFTKKFDLILVDAPCSGTGTLSRNPEIRWRLQPEDIADLAERQRGILANALAQLAPGGRLVYSTCSLEKEENEDIVNASGARVLQMMHRIPGRDPGDGFFAATLIRP